MERLLMQDLLTWQNTVKRKPLLLQGARQVGKTYLLKEFGERHFENVHHLDFTDTNLQQIVTGRSHDTEAIIFQIEAYLNHGIDRERDLVIFDEIQDAPEAITSLKYFCENCPELALCCAGSHIGIEGAASAFPVGKVTFLTLRPMTYREFLMASNSRLHEAMLQGTQDLEIPPAVHQMLWEQQKIYMLTGGMPEVVSQYIDGPGDKWDRLQSARGLQKGLLHGYELDFGKYCGPVNAQRIADVFRNIPVQIQQVRDDSIQRFRFRGVIQGQSKYTVLRGPIDWLTHSGLASKIHIASKPEPPLRGHTSENMFKLFPHDVGLMCASLDIRPAEVINQTLETFKGFLAEVFVAQELIGMGVCDSLVSWKSARSEIEFLLVHQGSVIPLEVKSGVRTRAKSLSVYKNTHSPELAIKLSAKNLRLEKAHLNAPVYMAGQLDSLIKRCREETDQDGPQQP